MNPNKQTALIMVIVAATLVYLSDSGKLSQISGIVKGANPTTPGFSWSGFFAGFPNILAPIANALNPLSGLGDLIPSIPGGTLGATGTDAAATDGATTTLEDAALAGG